MAPIRERFLLYSEKPGRKPKNTIFFEEEKSRKICKPGDLAAEASKHAKFIIANAAKKKLVISSAIVLNRPRF